MSADATAITFGGIPRVNLIPRSEIERRERAATARGWVWGILGAVIAAVAIIAGAIALNWIADQRLVAEQARTNSLLAELDSLSEVSAALATERDLNTFLADAMGSDLAWQPVITALRQELPGEVALSSTNLTVGGIPQSDDLALGTGLTGTITLTSPNAIDIAQTVRSLRTIPGVIYADGRLVQASQQEQAQYRYELSVTFDQSVYSGRFTETEGEQ